MTIRSIWPHLAIGLVALATTADGGQNSVPSRSVVADNLIAVPSGNGTAPVRACKKVCVKAGRGTDKIPAQCLQWKTVC